MTTIDNVSSALSEADHHAQLRRAVIASTVGTTIEWYDFFLYSQAPDWSSVSSSFPGGIRSSACCRRSPSTPSVLSPARSGRRFSAIRGSHRPQGGVGHDLADDRLCDLCGGLCPDLRADRHLGRRHPDHHSLHPGRRLGGEWGGSVLLSMEWARTNAHRGFIASWPQFGAPAGFFLANLAVLAFSAISGDQFLSLGMACPVLLSIFMVGVGLYIRLGILETPTFSAAAGRKPDRTDTSIRSDQAPAEVDHSGGVR